MSVVYSRASWLRILTALSLVLLSCALKNYLAVLAAGTPLCPYLCPSLMGVDRAFDLPPLAQVFSAQARVLEWLQYRSGLLLKDPHLLATALLFAPVMEEAIYRGPMYLARGMQSRSWWWSLGLLATVVFALSHGRGGLALLPLLVLGTCSLWLIATTRSFWPSLALHFLYNFFFTSVAVYQSLLLGD